MNYGELLKVVWQELDTVNKMTTEDYLAWIQAGNPAGSIPAGRGYYRTSEKGQAAIEEFGRKWRLEHADIRAMIEESDLDRITVRLFGEILDKKHVDRFGGADDEAKVIRKLLREQVMSRLADQTHYFPCHVFQSSEVGAFEVGPVRFIPVNDWPNEVAALAGRQMEWTEIVRKVMLGEMDAPKRSMRRTFEEIREHAEENRALNMLEDLGACAYVAVVRVPGRLGARSRSAAEVAVRVAIDALAVLMSRRQARQLRGPQDDLARRMLRPLIQNEGRDIYRNFAMDLPGIEVDKGDAQAFLDRSAEYRHVVGQALIDFIGVDGHSPHVNLHRRWVEAMYWYGQAKRNTTEFICIVECGVALDVLTEIGKAAGIQDLCRKVLVVPGTHLIWNNITLDDFVWKLYSEGRSQLSHGGRLGLLNELPVPSEVALNLLAVVLERYIKRLPNYSGADSARAYKDWLGSNPPSQSPPTP